MLGAAQYLPYESLSWRSILSFIAYFWTSFKVATASASKWKCTPIKEKWWATWHNIPYQEHGSSHLAIAWTNNLLIREIVTKSVDSFDSHRELATTFQAEKGNAIVLLKWEFSRGNTIEVSFLVVIECRNLPHQLFLRWFHWTVLTIQHIALHLEGTAPPSSLHSWML